MKEPYAFTFIIALVGIINGLGIVRWLTALAEVLRINPDLKGKPFWTFYLFASFHFLVHILFWWTLWGVREANVFNFLIYMYLLAGPIFLYLGTSLLSPQIGKDALDLKTHYFTVRKAYWTVLILMWVWSIFMWPLLVGSFAPTAVVFAINLIIALVLRISVNPTIHFSMAVISWAILVIFIVLFGMQLGGVGTTMGRG